MEGCARRGGGGGGGRSSSGCIKFSKTSGGGGGNDSKLGALSTCLSMRFAAPPTAISLSCLVVAVRGIFGGLRFIVPEGKSHSNPTSQPLEPDSEAVSNKLDSVVVVEIVLCLAATTSWVRSQLDNRHSSSRER